MKNHTSQDEKFLARTNTNAALPKTWSKPQLSATPLKDALSGGSNMLDAVFGARGS